MLSTFRCFKTIEQRIARESFECSRSALVARGATFFTHVHNGPDTLDEVLVRIRLMKSDELDAALPSQLVKLPLVRCVITRKARSYHLHTTFDGLECFAGARRAVENNVYAARDIDNYA